MDWPNSPHTDSMVDLMLDLNFPLEGLNSDSFDVVVLSDVLEHISEPALLMSEIARILKPGGRLLLNVPFIYWIHEGPYDYYRYTRFALDRLARQAGLEVVDLVPLGGWIEVMADLSSKLLEHFRLAFVVTSIHRLVMAFHRTRPGYRLSMLGSETLPLGYGLVAQKPMRTVP
ncbi:SAM-dependent methyltransferase [Mycobacterium sp. OAS707]|nr:SAM-dependent methyltransferase [Mycobacterium sp. OAS707]